MAVSQRRSSAFCRTNAERNVGAARRQEVILHMTTERHAQHDEQQQDRQEQDAQRHRPATIHDKVETWEDTCVCEPEPRWQKVAEEIEQKSAAAEGEHRGNG